MSFVASSGVDLQELNGMRVPATAAYMSPIESVEDIIAARKFIAQKRIPMMVIGEGSNTLFTKDYPGLIVHNRLMGVVLLEDLPDSVLVRVGAGESWHDFVSTTINQGWHGLENLALIPGLVGAAPIQNIGAYGVEVKDHIISVEYFDLKTQGSESLSNADCRFAYRDSIFKRDLVNRAVITSVVFRLSKRSKTKISYPALQDYFARRPAPSPHEIFVAVCHIRNSKLRGC